ncbi:unnamed protein product [Closterium sp. NIES-54]
MGHPAGSTGGGGAARLRAPLLAPQHQALAPAPLPATLKKRACPVGYIFTATLACPLPLISPPSCLCLSRYPSLPPPPVSSSYLPVNISIDRFNPDLHLTTSPGQKVASAQDPTGATVDCPKLPYSRHVYDFGVRMSTALKSKLQDTNFYLRARDPFPMGRIRTPLARPDLISLATFHGILYNLKLVVLVRNLTDTVLWSVLRRFHNDDVGLQARLIEDSMVYIDASLRTLPCGTFSLIDVDALVKRPKTASTALAQFLGLPGVAKEEVFSAIQRGKEKWEPTLTVQSGLGATADGDEAAEVTFDGQALEVFFQQRVGLWPLLDAAKGKPVFVPRNPQDWPLE